MCLTRTQQRNGKDSVTRYSRHMHTHCSMHMFPQLSHSQTATCTAHTHTCTYAYTRTHIHIHTHARTHTRRHTCRAHSILIGLIRPTYICVYIQYFCREITITWSYTVYIYGSGQPLTHTTHTCVQTSVHTHTYTHIHTYTLTGPQRFCPQRLSATGSTCLAPPGSYSRLSRMSSGLARLPTRKSLEEGPSEGQGAVCEGKGSESESGQEGGFGGQVWESKKASKKASKKEQEAVGRNEEAAYVPTSSPNHLKQQQQQQFPFISDLSQRQQPQPVTTTPPHRQLLQQQRAACALMQTHGVSAPRGDAHAHAHARLHLAAPRSGVRRAGRVCLIQQAVVVCARGHTHTHTQAHAHTHSQAHTRTHTHAHTHTHTHAHTRAHTHTHKRTHARRHVVRDG